MAFDIRLVDPGLILFVQIGAGLGIDVPPHRVVPVRFARAVKGLADPSAPDIDDRGFTDAVHGPAVGVMRGNDVGGDVQPGPEARVQVIRDRVEPTAKLFPVLADCASVQLTFPPAGSPLDEIGDPFDPARGPDIVAFQSTSTDSDEHDCTLSIRHGSVNGPVMAQMLIRVYPVKPVIVQLHRIKVKGVAPNTTAADLDVIFGIVNRIYAQAGVRFILVRDAQGRPLTLDDDFDTGGGGPGVLFTPFFFELSPVSKLQYQKGKLNVYIFHEFSEHDVAGIGLQRAAALLNTPPANPALFLQDLEQTAAGERLQSIAHAAAHEIGHTLNLNHFQQCIGGQKEFRCNSLWARRSLMCTSQSLRQPGSNRPDFSANSRVGYGTTTIDGETFPRSGELLSTKPFGNIPQGDQIKQLRQAIDAATYTTFTPI